jgi:hypothetical protein
MSDYNHYIRIDANNIVIDGYADWQTEKRNADEIQLSGNFIRQFQTQLTNDRLQYLYKYVDGQMVLRDQSELDTEWAARPPDAPSLQDQVNSVSAALISLMGL